MLDREHLEALLQVGIDAGRATNARDFEHNCEKFRAMSFEMGLMKDRPPRSLARALNLEASSTLYSEGAEG